MPVLQKVMDKDVWNTMDFAVEAFGGLVFGTGDPLHGRCGCLLSIASLVDGRCVGSNFYYGDIGFRTGIYAPPKKGERVLKELYRVFGMPPKACSPGTIAGANDSTCYHPLLTWDGEQSAWVYRGMSWREFCKLRDIVPSC